MGTERVVESLSAGLKALGHDVYMKVLPSSVSAPVPIVQEIPEDTDIIHFHHQDFEYCESFGKPWAYTIHGGGHESDPDWLEEIKNSPHIICISKYISDRLSCPHYVHNCISPEDFIFSDQKDDYFLWMAGTDWGEAKGLLTSIYLARQYKFNLKIAGTGNNQEMINLIKENCDDKIEYLGAINGKVKAEVLSKAKAVLNIGKIRDAFCLVNVEALISGTPVIARNTAAHIEILNKDVAFLCDSDQDILRAMLKVGKIDHEGCRKYAHDNFNNVKIAKDYLKQYERILKGSK